jgi:hypothetical protein
MMIGGHIMFRRLVLISLAGAAIAIGACDMRVREKEGKEGGKEVDIRSSLGDLSVRTDDVDPAATGLSVYPGSRLKERAKNDDNRANVNIDTPWFGVKVVALTYQTDDAPDKVWEYYKKEITTRYGRPLECRPGSPDLERKKQNDDDLVCEEKSRKIVVQDVDFKTTRGMELKVGTDDRQRIVAMKPRGKGTEFALVYVVTREGRETM